MIYRSTIISTDKSFMLTPETRLGWIPVALRFFATHEFLFLFCFAFFSVTQTFILNRPVNSSLLSDLAFEW